MINAVACDFETYFDGELTLDSKKPTNRSVEAYIHALQEAGHWPPYLVSLYDGAHPLRQYAGSLKDAPWSLFADCEIVLAHNARFDKAVYQACVKTGMVPGEFLSKRWVCTADMSVYHHAPRNLAGASKWLLGVEVSKEYRKVAKGKIYANLSQERQEEIQKAGLVDAKTCWTLADKWLGGWPEEEQKISDVNREAGMYGVKLNEELVASDIKLLHQIKFDAEKKLPWRNDPDAPDTAVLSPKAVVKLCQEAGIPMPTRMDDGVQKDTLAQNEPEVLAWEEKYGEKYPWVAAMRDYRKANILLKKLQTMQRHSVEGILYWSLLYFGAHTGRFSGSGGMNMQNLPGRKASFVSLRNKIIARPGKELCVIDWCQIEPRILRWVVKDQEAWDLLAKGISIYEAYAIQHFKWVAGEIPLKKANPALYGLAKAAVLGAGYGCGPRKYKAVAKTMADIDLTEEEAAHQVALFRQDNPKVVGLWNRLSFAAKLSASKHKDFSLALPSGRKLHYFKPTLMNGLSAATTMDLGKISFLHGGLLTENYIQAAARDVFALGLMRLADAHVQNLFHVHDEYVLEVEKDNRAGAEEDFKAVLLAPIPWLPGCPLDVEFKWKEHYV